jgi:1,4-alpha-glucan branching enzyme
LDWYVLEYPNHSGLKQLVSDLNRLYRENPALHRYDFEQKGFEWIDCHDAPQSTLSYLRQSSDESAVMVFNFTPVPRQNYRIGVPEPGVYREIFNSDSRHYGGSNIGNSAVTAEAKEWMGRPYSISLTLPPLAGIVLTCEVLKEDEPEPPE